MTLQPIPTAQHPTTLARLGFAVAHVIDANAPEVPDCMRKCTLWRGIADALKKAKRPLIVTGPVAVAWRLLRQQRMWPGALDSGRPAALSLITPECNSFGLALLGGASAR